MPKNHNKKILMNPSTKVNIKNSSQPLKENNLSWAGKIFFAAIAAYILGDEERTQKLPIKVRGTPEQMRAVVDAIVSSKEFQQEISKPGATVDSVIDKLKLRNTSKDAFRKVSGKDWPL